MAAVQFTVKPLNDIISDLLLNVFNNINDVTDGNAGGIMRQMLEAVAQEISLLYDQLQNIYDGSRVSTAIGTDLEEIGLLVGVDRKDGTNSTGFASFIRNQVAGADFTISANSIVSTQPNTGEEQLRFLVASDTIFDADIDAESHDYVDGLLYYPMDERLIDSVQQVSATVSATPGTILTQGVDYEISSVSNQLIVDPNAVLLVDDCETANWTESADATADALDAVDFIQGANSLDLGKSGTSSTLASYEKVLGTVVDGTDKDMHLSLKIIDNTALAKIDRIEITYGSGGDATNAYTLSFSNSDLADAVGSFYRFFIDRTDTELTQTGFPSVAATNFIKIDIYTNLAGDVLTSGDVKMDFWFFGDSSLYSGDTIKFITTGTVPDDGTSFLVDYKPLSKEVPIISEDVGAKYNVGANKIVFKVSSIPSVDAVNNYEATEGGTDIETDDELRDRIQESSLAGKATASAIRQAVLAVDGITSVTVDDLPRKTATDEVHRYAIATDTYKLDFEVAQDTATLDVEGTLSATPGHTFVQNTDFVLDSSSQIVWQGGGDNPDDDTDFFVDYDYDWLGHVEVFVSGTQSPLPASVLSDVDDAIEDTRAAGVIVTVLEPTVVTIDVTATIVVEGGASTATVLTAVESALRTYLNTLDVGIDIFRSELIRIIQETEGVSNSTLTVPAADVTIDVDEVAKAGTLTISV